MGPYLCSQKKLRRVSSTVPFCVAFVQQRSKLQSKHSKVIEQSQITGQLSSIFKVDSNEQYGRKDNVRIFGVQKEENENVYQFGGKSGKSSIQSGH